MELEDQLRDLQNKVGTLLILLQGNPLDKNDDGLFGRLLQMEERLKKVENWKQRVAWTFVGMMLPASYGIASFVTTHFFHLKG